jgi:hypothetical protein
MHPDEVLPRHAPGPQPPVTRRNGRRACRFARLRRVDVHGFRVRTHRPDRQPRSQTTRTIRFDRIRDIRSATERFKRSVEKPALPDGPPNRGPEGRARRAFFRSARLGAFCGRLLRRADLPGPIQRSPRNRTRLAQAGQQAGNQGGYKGPGAVAGRPKSAG